MIVTVSRVEKSIYCRAHMRENSDRSYESQRRERRLGDGRTTTEVCPHAMRCRAKEKSLRNRKQHVHARRERRTYRGAPHALANAPATVAPPAPHVTDKAIINGYKQKPKADVDNEQPISANNPNASHVELLYASAHVVIEFTVRYPYCRSRT